MDYEPYLAQLTLNSWSPETIKAYRSDLGFFNAFLRGRNLRITQVTPTVVGAYVEHMRQMPNPRFGKTGLAQTSIARRLAVLSGFFEFLRATTRPQLRNPITLFTRRSRRPTNKNHVDKAIDEASLDILIQRIDNVRDRAIILLLLNSGLRLSELHRLDIASIQEVSEQEEDGTSRTFGTGRVVGKGLKERVFYFDVSAIAAIKEYLMTRKDTHPALFLSERKQRLSKRAIQDLVAGWCKRLGLRHWHPHNFRHTFGKTMANANMEAMVLRDLMGHSRFETTTRYFTLSEETRARQYFAAMEFVRGPQP